MLNCQRQKTLLHLNGIIIRISQIPNCHCALWQRSLSPFALKYSTAPSDKRSFVVSYLTNTCGFSPETAKAVSNKVRFETALKPDLVLTFFRNHGFSDAQINDIIKKEPCVLVSNPNKTLLPKFNFLLSKGACNSDIVHMVTASPILLHRSLEKRIIPLYGLIKGFLPSDKETIARLKYCPFLLWDNRVALNIKLLLDSGMPQSSITRIFHMRLGVLCSSHMWKTMQELKKLGFDPSKSDFSVALCTKLTLMPSQWDAKVDTFKSWGWSEDVVLDAFRREPRYMLRSKDKINAFMSFWVRQLGWNSLVLVKGPVLFNLSLHKRIIPRASVVQYLLSKGLRDMNASLITPFIMSEKLFLQKFVTCYKMEESSLLLKLYQEKMNLPDDRESSCME